MAFRFVHTADWHIGKAFGSFGPDKAALLRDARYAAVETIVDAARTHAAADILVAGDVFDGPGLPDSVLRKLLSLLKAAGDLTWHVLPGNHDPDQAHGVWARIAHMGTPNNVIVHRHAAPYRMSDDAIVLPAPLDQKQMSADPTAWFDQAERGPHDIVVGLAHGSTQGFGGGSEASIPIQSERADVAGLDYLALGDWHGTTQVTAKAWYSGTPEPEGYVDNDPGNVLLVDIAGPGANPSVTPVRTAKYTWQRHKVVCGSFDNIALMTELLANARDGAPRRLIRLDLEGELAVADEAALRVLLDEAAPTFFDLDVRWQELEIAAADADTELFENDLIAAVAKRLMDQSSASDGAGAATSQRALRLLASLALRHARPQP